MGSSTPLHHPYLPCSPTTCLPTHMQRAAWTSCPSPAPFSLHPNLLHFLLPGRTGFDGLEEKKKERSGREVGWDSILWCAFSGSLPGVLCCFLPNFLDRHDSGGSPATSIWFILWTGRTSVFAGHDWRCVPHNLCTPARDSQNAAHAYICDETLPASIHGSCHCARPAPSPTTLLPHTHASLYHMAGNPSWWLCQPCALRHLVFPFCSSCNYTSMGDRQTCLCWPSQDTLKHFGLFFLPTFCMLLCLPI